MSQANNRRVFITSIVASLAAACTKKRAKEAGPAPATYKVQLKTSKGDVVILVHRDWAPRGADRFYDLVNMGYYDRNKFFRCIKGFVVQFGMNGDPKVNKDWSELYIKDDPSKVSNKIGTITFATSGPNTRSSQVFINLGDNSRLDKDGFTPFGEVIQGMENIEALYMGYGDGPPFGPGPDQNAIASDGNDYLEEKFSKLDYIKTARVVG